MLPSLMKATASIPAGASGAGARGGFHPVLVPDWSHAGRLMPTPVPQDDASLSARDTRPCSDFAETIGDHAPRTLKL